MVLICKQNLCFERWLDSKLNNSSTRTTGTTRTRARLIISKNRIKKFNNNNKSDIKNYKINLNSKSDKYINKKNWISNSTTSART